MSVEVKKMEMRMCLCTVSAIEAALICGPSWHYTLRCHPYNRGEAMRMFSSQAKVADTNPLAPAVNFEFDPSMGQEAWSLEANGIRVENQGC